MLFLLNPVYSLIADSGSYNVNLEQAHMARLFHQKDLTKLSTQVLFRTIK